MGRSMDGDGDGGWGWGAVVFLDVSHAERLPLARGDVYALRAHYLAQALAKATLMSQTD